MKSPGAGAPGLPITTRGSAYQERVTVYAPQAVNWIVTISVWPPRTTAAVIFPASNRGAFVQVAL
jgi:hypothetical protein